MIKLLVGMLIFSSFLILSTPSMAAILCRNGLEAIPFSVMTKILKRKYGEVPSHLGTVGEGTMVQFTNREKETMSLLYVNPQGLTCMIASAEDWDYNDQLTLPGEGS